MRLSFVLLATFLSLFVSQAYAVSFTGKLVKVLDGDTVEVLHDGKAERIRLAQIDCPEKGQPFGQVAKEYVISRVAGKIVLVDVKDKDRYGRSVCEVFLPSGGSLNDELVGEGYAWHYKQYSDDTVLDQLEQQAREKKIGLWQDKAPVPPWEWRKGQRQASSVPVTGEDFTCGSKRYCKEMTSCAEAKFYLKECGVRSLDGDGDGKPCESIYR